MVLRYLSWQTIPVNGVISFYRRTDVVGLFLTGKTLSRNGGDYIYSLLRIRGACREDSRSLVFAQDEISAFCGMVIEPLTI